MKRTTFIACLIAGSFAVVMPLAQAQKFSPLDKRATTTPPEPKPQTQAQVDKAKPQQKVQTPPAPAPVPATAPSAAPGVPPAPQPPAAPVSTEHKHATKEEGDSKKKVSINHKGKVISVDEHAVKAHLAHGDTVVSGGDSHDHDKGKGKAKNKGKKGD